MKNNQKCIRISDKTLGFIEGFSGNGFNQKLENMVMYFMEGEKELKARIYYFEAEEKRLLDNIDKLRRIERGLTEIRRYLDDIKKLTESLPVPGQLKIV